MDPVRLRRGFSRFRDDHTFTSAKYDQTIGLVMGHTILAMGGKEHHDHRNSVAKAFRATALERWEPSVIGPVCDQLVDEIKDHGEADLVEAVTFEFPTRIISTLLGLPPQDLDLFRRLSLDLISIPTNIMAGLTAANELHGYFLNQVEQRRRKLTNDIIGDLVAAEIDGEKLTDEAIIAFLRLLLPVGWVYDLPLVLCGQPAVPTADPSRATRDGLPRPVVDTRWRSKRACGSKPPSPWSCGPQGRSRNRWLDNPDPDAQIDMCMGSANRDDSRWTDPNTFDIRRPRQAHVAFAGGIHMCLGMHLAKTGNPGHAEQLVRQGQRT